MKTLRIAILLSILTGLSISCQEKPKQQVTETNNEQQDNDHKDIIVISKKQFKANDMTIGQVVIDTFYQKVTAQGVLDVPPSNKAVVSSFLPGKVKNIKLIVGDKVRKGQLLAQISDPEYLKIQQDYIQAKENLDYQKQEYNRQKELAKEGVTSQKKWQETQRQYRTAKARYYGLLEQLKMLRINPKNVENGILSATTNIYAPISGYISNLYVTEGSAVGEQDKIMEIINNNHIHLELQVFEKNIMKIKKGQTIIYKVPGLEEQTYKGYVKLIGREINPDTRSILVHGHLEETHPKFIAGIYIEAKILTKQFPGLSVPDTAIIKDSDEVYVLKLIKMDDEDYEFVKVPVKIVEENTQKIHIDSKTLSKGDKILSKGGFFLIGGGEGGHEH